MSRLRVDRLTGLPGQLVTGEGVVLALRCHTASSLRARLVGLLATPDLTVDEALWLEPCSSVHALALRAPIGCAFLDADGRALRIVDPLRPWRAASVRGARAVVECRAGVLEGVTCGDVLIRR
jgi:uncharacterized membrane protein (UPF0127 family)